MNNRIIIDSKPSDFNRTWFVKFNEKTGKILRVANKPMTDDPHAGVLVTETQNKELVGGLTSGKIDKRTIGIIWDPVNEKYDLGKKSNTLLIRELDTKLLQITDNNPVAKDIFIQFFKDPGILDISIDIKTVQQHFNLGDIHEISNTSSHLLDLYFTKRNDPDWLIKSVKIDPVLLFRHTRISVDIREIIDLLDTDNISVFTRPIFHQYGIEYLDKYVETDFSNNKRKVLQLSHTQGNAHIYITEVEPNKLKIISDIRPSSSYIFRGQDEQKFLVTDGTPDGILGGFSLDVASLLSKKTIYRDVQFDWPSKPTILYRNHFLNVKHGEPDVEFN